MKVKIRLKQEWDNAGTKYPEGLLLMLDEENVKALVDKGV